MIKRITIEILLFVAVILLFVTDTYMVLPAPVQLILLKIILVSNAIIHAHVARKLMFPTVDWDATELQGKHYVSIAFYITLPLCYAFGG